MADTSRTSKGTGNGTSNTSVNSRHNAYRQLDKRVLPHQRTDIGMNDNQRKAVRAVEQANRNNKDESLYAFDENGREVYFKQGKGARVSGIDTSTLKDTILTHNHPRSIGAKGFDAIGHSFSKADVDVAISGNVKEIHAVTPTYTYSLRRPTIGWGVNSKTFKTYYNKVLQEVSTKTGEHEYSRGRIVNGMFTGGRSAYIYDQTMKQVAKHFKWEYTRTRH